MGNYSIISKGRFDCALCEFTGYDNNGIAQYNAIATTDADYLVEDEFMSIDHLEAVKELVVDHELIITEEYAPVCFECFKNLGFRIYSDRFDPYIDGYDIYLRFYA